MRKNEFRLSNKKPNKLIKVLLMLFGAAALLVVIYFLPPVHDRIA
jgi:hypothetical protein